MSQKEHLVGFLVLHEDSPNSFIGAILITDKNGFPIEYRFTEKIQIEEVKRLLYGDSLRAYLMVEIIGITLIESLEKKPALILTREEEFLKLRGKTDLPIACVGDEEKLSFQELLNLAQTENANQTNAKTTSVLFEEDFAIREPFERIIRILKSQTN
jgi:hypothetical protein